jgi:NADP-dependent 3-hydroxy acid dehydrogenase YdfG
MVLGLRGKAAVVSGSTAGIGLAIATALATEGAKVVVNGRTEARVAAALDKIRQRVANAELRGVAARDPTTCASSSTTRCHCVSPIQPRRRSVA